MQRAGRTDAVCAAEPTDRWLLPQAAGFNFFSRHTMASNRSLALHTLAAALALLSFGAAQAANLSKPDYAAGKTRIDADYQAAKASCAPETGNAQDVCLEVAKARQQVARAELEFGYTGKPADEIKIRVARAESAYGVAKERCDDLAGNTKAVCVKEAKAVEVKALAEARLVKSVGEASRDAAADVREADYKVAAEKCDAMAGDAKSTCIAAAKSRYGKS